MATSRKSRSRTSNRPFIGIDLGGTNINVGIVEFDRSPAGRGGGGTGRGRVRLESRVNKKTQAIQGNATVIDRVADAVRESCDLAGIGLKKVAGVGIGAPGALDPATGVVLKAPNLGFVNVPLAARLSKKLDGLPVYLENDVNAAAYGEWKQGAAVGASDVLAVWIGTGVGGGLILAGRLFGGGQHTAGEIGHMTLLPGAPYGRRSVEQNCSRTAIAERLVSLVGSGHASSLKKSIEEERKKIKDKGDFDPSKLIRSRHIAQAFASGDALTHRVIGESADLLGTAVAGVVTLLSLPHVVIGGGMTEALGEPFVKLIRAAVKERVFPSDLRKVQVVGTALKENAGIVGAAILAREHL